MKKLIVLSIVLYITVNGFSQKLIYKSVIVDSVETKNIQASENTEIGKDEIIEIIEIFKEALNKVLSVVDTGKTDLSKADYKPEIIKTELLEMFKNALDDANSGETDIGRIILKKYAFVFNNKNDFSKKLKTSNELRAIRSQVNSEISLGKAVKGVKLEFDGEEIIANIVKIDSVKFDIKEGLIEFIKIYMHDGSTYYNRYAPIQLIGIEHRFCDKLFNTEDNSFIFLKDVLSFEADTRFNYFPNNEQFTLKNDSLKNGSRTLSADNGINSLVGIQVYSDMLALFGDQANGLVQVEANSKIYLHRHNIPGKFMYVVYAIEPFFQFNKLDSKFDTIISTSAEINRMDVYRRSTFSTGLSLSLFRWDWRPSNTLQIKAGYLFSSSNVVINNIKTEGIFHTPYTELSLTSRRMSNFGMDMNGRFLWQKLNDNNNFSNIGWNTLISLGASVYYFPSKKSEKDKIFLRFINFLNHNDRTLDYYLLQFGISKQLNFK